MSFSGLCTFFRLITEHNEQKLEFAVYTIIYLLECLDSQFNTDTKIKWKNRLCFLIKFNEILQSSQINLNGHDIIQMQYYVGDSQYGLLKNY